MVKKSSQYGGQKTGGKKMALIKCKECGKEFSSSATVCPNCGKRGTSLFTKFIAVIFVLGFINFLLRPDTGGQRAEAEAARLAKLTPQEKAAEDSARRNAKSFGMAREACYVALHQSLNDPDSAKLDSALSWYVEMRKDGTVLVQPSGRAKNAFGAYMQGVWNCVVKIRGDDKHVISLKQIRQ